MINNNEVIKALKEIMDPDRKQDIVSLNYVTELEVKENTVTVHFKPDSMNRSSIDFFRTNIQQNVSRVDEVHQVNVVFDQNESKEEATQPNTEFGGVQDLNHIKKVIAVMSGKGGVGKSLVTGLLAVSLRKAGYRVGILDADITGPSIPKMFFKSRPEVNYSSRAMLPSVTDTGIKVMSINLLLPNEEEAVIWRGPLIGQAIKQFWTDTLWEDIDFFLVDLPPGTSDAPLTVMQSLPMSGVLLVTSPQDLAGMVVRKAANMVNQVGIPVLGLVENMSFYIAPDTGKQYDVFGPSHAELTAKALNIPILARLPIDPLVTILCDEGKVEEFQMPEFDAVVEWIKTSTLECLPPMMQSKAQKTAWK